MPFEQGHGWLRRSLAARDGGSVSCITQRTRCSLSYGGSVLTVLVEVGHLQFSQIWDRQLCYLREDFVLHQKERALISLRTEDALAATKARSAALCDLNA